MKSEQPLGEATVKVIYFTNDNDNVMIVGCFLQQTVDSAFIEVENIAGHVVERWTRAINWERSQS